MKNTNKLTTLIVLTIILTTILTAPTTQAAAARVYFSAVSPDKSGYAVDETVKINIKYKWEGLTANQTVTIQLWNATDLMETLGTYTTPYNISGTLTPSGTKTIQYTPTTDLTEETGTTTYSVKMLSAGIVVDTADLVILVADSQTTMSITWQDQNNDRIVDQNELVTFTAYINWAFVETTEAHSLYVNYGDGDKLLSTVTITAGSGSQTVTDSHGFNTRGAKTAKFTLKDATGTTVKTSTATLTVGQPATTTPTTTTTQKTSIVGMITANWAILAIVAAFLVLGYIYLNENKANPGR